MLTFVALTFVPRFWRTIARLGALTAKCGSALTISANCESEVLASSEPRPSFTSIEPRLLAVPSAETAQRT